MTETIYARQRRTVLVAHPRWSPPAMPCGAWMPVRPLDERPQHNGMPQSSQSVRVWLVSRDGRQTEGYWCDWLGWQVRTGPGAMDFDDADTDSLVGWRGMVD